MELADIAFYVGGFFILLISGAIVWIAFAASSLHDPARALASTPAQVASGFELSLPDAGAPKLYFRFELRGFTEDPYDLVVRGEIESADGSRRPCGGRTAENTRVEGAADVPFRDLTYAMTTVGGSILLEELRPGDRVVRGRIEEHPKGLLERGWIYVPKGPTRPSA